MSVAPRCLPAAVPQIAMTGVSKYFGNGRAILYALDMTVAKGEFVSIVGPSGCGKSTMLKLICGLTAPTEGTILVDGLKPQNAREMVSYIFQDATLLPWRTVRQNVVLGLELEGMTRERRRELSESLLHLVGLSDVANAYPRELSGGMRMRVSVARALATKPKLLLMDEPFAALDEITRDRLNEELLRLRAAQNWTAVFVTHSVAEAVFLSSRVIVLAPNPGRIHAEYHVTLPQQRDATLRGAPEFEALAAQVSRALREAQNS